MKSEPIDILMTLPPLPIGVVMFLAKTSLLAGLLMAHRAYSVRFFGVKQIPIKDSWLIIMESNHVFFLTSYYEVSWSVIKAIMVNMVYHLGSLKFSAKKLFHYISVLKNLLAIDGNGFVATVDRAGAIFSFHSRVFIKVASVFLIIKMFSTQKTCNYFSINTIIEHTIDHRNILPCH